MIPLFYRFCQTLLFIIFKVWNRFEIIGAEHLPKKTGYILAPNHVSYLDPPVLGGGFREPLVFLAREELFSIAVLAPVIRMLGAMPIAGDSDFRSLRLVVRALQAGKHIVIFPEGTRAKAGEFLEPQPGVAFLAHAAKVPVVPCYIEGTDKVWPKGKKSFYPAKIRVKVGKPLDFHSQAVDPKHKQQHYEQCASLIMERIQELKNNP